MIKKSLNRLSFLLDVLPQRLSTIPESEFSKKPAPEKWSRKEILGHLVDSAVNNHCRFIRSQYEQVPHIVYDQDAWNSLNHYNDLGSGQLISFWTMYNQHILFVMQHIDGDGLKKLCNSGGKEPFTLQYLFDDYVVHLEHHLRQIVDY